MPRENRGQPTATYAHPRAAPRMHRSGTAAARRRQSTSSPSTSRSTRRSTETRPRSTEIGPSLGQSRWASMMSSRRGRYATRRQAPPVSRCLLADRACPRPLRLRTALCPLLRCLVALRPFACQMARLVAPQARQGRRRSAQLAVSPRHASVASTWWCRRGRRLRRRARRHRCCRRARAPLPLRPSGAAPKTGAPRTDVPAWACRAPARLRAPSPPTSPRVAPLLRRRSRRGGRL